jgi:hypothetical protein
MASVSDDDFGGSSDGGSCTYTLFQLVNHSSSITVVECFLGLLIFTIFMEVILSGYTNVRNMSVGFLTYFADLIFTTGNTGEA